MQQPTYAAVPPPKNKANASTENPLMGGSATGAGGGGGPSPSTNTDFSNQYNPNPTIAMPSPEQAPVTVNNTNGNTLNYAGVGGSSGASSTGNGSGGMSGPPTTSTDFLNRHSPQYHHDPTEGELHHGNNNGHYGGTGPVVETYNDFPYIPDQPTQQQNFGQQQDPAYFPPAQPPTSYSSSPPNTTIEYRPYPNTNAQPHNQQPYPPQQQQMYNNNNPSNMNYNQQTSYNNNTGYGAGMGMNPNMNQNVGPNNTNMYGGGMMQQQQQQRKPPKRSFLKLVVIGSSAVGKTSLMNRYHSNKFSGQRKVTIGADCHSKEITIPSTTNTSHQQKCTLQIWDTAGQERFRSLGTSFYRGADACMLVYDVTDPKTFEDLDTWRNDFLTQIGRHTENSGMEQQMHQQTMNSYDGRSSVGSGASPYGVLQQGNNMKSPNFPIVLIGNKIDKITDEEELSQIRARAEAWCQSKAGASGIPIPYFEASAKTSVNVDVAFVKSATLALEEAERRKMNEPVMKYPPVQQTIDLNRGGDDFENNGCC